MRLLRALRQLRSRLPGGGHRRRWAPRRSRPRALPCSRHREIPSVTIFADAPPRGLPRPGLRIRLFAQPEVLTDRLAQRPLALERRFERSGSPERELELYKQADELLTAREQLSATVFDTTATDAQELGAVVAELIL